MIDPSFAFSKKENNFSMVKRAFLYIRVSTDEQAKGYSPDHQEEQLRKYCGIFGIEVVAVFKEDYSAKTFERPEFRKLLELAKKNKGKIDYLLFINWSRFSRNTADAYSMIGTLRKLQIEPQATEQPLDLTVPEQKMMLAFYLSAPEVENDRRSLNVLAGMRRARKSGRWPGNARIGYKNIRDEKGSAWIVPSDQAPLMIEAFNEMEKALITQKELFLKLKRKGLKCAEKNFYYALKDPIYCGKIFVPAYKDEEACYVKGVHDPLISEELFMDVQDILSGRKNKYPARQTRNDELPLRGFLECPKCGGNMTGSASKGNGGKYYYYHCQPGCKERFKAEDANKLFLKELSKIRANSDILEAYHIALKDKFSENEKDASKTVQKLNEEIKKNQERIFSAEKKMLDEEIAASEYRSIKNRYESTISDLMREKAKMETLDSNYLDYLKGSVAILKSIDRAYESADLVIKQKIIGSIFPEKLIFENNQYRTKSINRAVALIAQNNSKLLGHKKGLNENLIIQSSNVGPVGIEPTTT
ncbi:MAG: resolvase [Chitinophagaceae bacterium]|nr:resolvase [Chitinophagaceae bacterium]